MPRPNGRTPQRIVRRLLLADAPCHRATSEVTRASCRGLSVLRGAYDATEARRVPAVLPRSVARWDSASREAGGGAVGLAAGLGWV